MSVYDLPIPIAANFTDFVMFDHFFLPHEVDRINSLWNSAESEKAPLSGDEAYNEQLRKSRVQFILPDEQTRWIYDRLSQAAEVVNRERYVFDLRGYYQPLQLTEYQTGDFFDWHLDFGAGEISHRKLSLTVQLSEPDDYSGGVLEFMINSRHEPAPVSRGTVIVFPSFIQHRVTPVTSGIRRSIVGWVSGPPYR